jgi:Holliday junction resolvase RusA-like endonuclease
MEKKEKHKKTQTIYPPQLLRSVKLEIPYIPPSINELYFTRFGRRCLSTAGKVFKVKVKDHLVNNYLEELQKLNPRSLYEMQMFFYLPKDEIFTKNYLKDKNTKSPIKRRDVGNMEKILVDCISEMVFEDDCQVFKEVLTKIPSETQKVVIILIELDTDAVTSELHQVERQLIANKINHYKSLAK